MTTLEKKLLTDDESGEVCGCSGRHIRRQSELGAMPGPVRLGRSVRWRKQELLDWIAAGCPDLRKEGSTNAS